MNSKEYREFLEAYNGIYEQVKVPADATDAEALKGLIPKGEKVHEVPRKKPSLQNASYEPEGDEYLDEAPVRPGAPSGRNYGDPVAAKWNKELATFSSRKGGGEMTPPSIPKGYAYNPQAGTITRGGVAPSTAATARSRPTTPVTPNNKRDPEFRRGPTAGAGNMNAGRSSVPTATAPRPAATAPRPAATAPRPAATAVRPTVPTTRPPATASIAPRPVAQPAETGTQASAGAVRGMIGSSMARQAATSTPQLSARAQALKVGGPQGGARARVLNQDLDLFDIIKGHLLDEGYADTEESALVIMANMSEEWRNSIVESDSIADLKKKIEVEKLKGQLDVERNKRYAAAELKSGSYGVPSFARSQEQQKEYQHSDAGLTKAQSRQILSQNRRSLESAAGVKPGSTEKDAWYNDPNYGKQLTGKGKFFSPRTVLAKQGGKEGKLTTDPNTGKKTFTATKWTGAEQGRYKSKGGK